MIHINNLKLFWKFLLNFWAGNWHSLIATNLILSGYTCKRYRRINYKWIRCRWASLFLLEAGMRMLLCIIVSCLVIGRYRGASCIYHSHHHLLLLPPCPLPQERSHMWDRGGAGLAESRHIQTSAHQSTQLIFNLPAKEGLGTISQC